MRWISYGNDLRQVGQILRRSTFTAYYKYMQFSKSFGYALRGVLYVASCGTQKEKVQLHEIAEKLAVPKYFLGKIMQQVTRSGILSSDKGQQGGFYINDTTMSTTIRTLKSAMGAVDEPDSCVLRLRKCNDEHPCPLHDEYKLIRMQWDDLLAKTTISDLIEKSPQLLKSITVLPPH